jgi:UDP-N-acetylmuramyl pentapeptide phosphotransferase/UDP-N-acetylglucosamine-1-phosphate transferase
LNLLAEGSFTLLSGLLLAVGGAAIAYALIYALLGWLKVKALAHPNRRSSHSNPTPQGAGLAVVPVALAGGALALALGPAPAAASLIHVAAVIVAGLALMVVGLLDDVLTLPVVPRLAAHAFAALLVVATLPAEARIVGDPLPLLAERAILFFAVVWFINLMNFMDGIDWISAIETGSITLGVAMLAALGLLPGALGWGAAALLGATAGFMPWNAPPARVFLGDAGSLPLGLLLATLLIHVGTAGAWAAALILPLYYLADATVTLARRLLRGARIWEAHREHFYQRALRGGMPLSQILGQIAGVNAALIALALAATLVGTAVAAVSALLAASVVVALTLRKLAGGDGATALGSEG